MFIRFPNIYHFYNNCYCSEVDIIYNNNLYKTLKKHDKSYGTFSDKI